MSELFLDPGRNVYPEPSLVPRPVPPKPLTPAEYDQRAIENARKAGLGTIEGQIHLDNCKRDLDARGIIATPAQLLKAWRDGADTVKKEVPLEAVLDSIRQPTAVQQSRALLELRLGRPASPGELAQFIAAQKGTDTRERAVSAANKLFPK